MSKSSNLDKIALFNAVLATFLFIFLLKSCGTGPKATPPCLNMLDLIDPALALPVPFCLHGFTPPPLTSALVLTFLVPCL